MQEKKFGLITAITMIIGIVIGSGIFFKSDNILMLAGGNIWIGVLVFCLASIGVIFGCLAISELASRTSRDGGVVSYARKFAGHNIAGAFGWFFGFIYYPSLTAVVSWVVGVYASNLFGIPPKLEMQILIGLVFCSLCYLYNIFAPKFGALFQSGATIVKLIPLFLIAIIGFVFGNPEPLMQQSITHAFTSTTWIAAVTPIAFSFDGWVASTSISGEMKNAKKNIPLALVISPLFVLLVYIAYFVGISILIGPEKVIELGDMHVSLAAKAVFGDIGEKIITILILISVMGTVNGLIISNMRAPYAMALSNTIPCSNKIKIINKKLDIAVNSAVLSFAIAVLWFVLHYTSMKFELLPNSDVSEISIVISYVLYSILYVKVIGLYKTGEIKSKVKGVIVPLIAMAGSAIMLLGGVQSKLFPIYTLLCLTILLLGFSFAKSRTE